MARNRISARSPSRGQSWKWQNQVETQMAWLRGHQPPLKCTWAPGGYRPCPLIFAGAVTFWGVRGHRVSSPLSRLGSRAQVRLTYFPKNQDQRPPPRDTHGWWHQWNSGAQGFQPFLGLPHPPSLGAPMNRPAAPHLSVPREPPHPAAPPLTHAARKLRRLLPYIIFTPSSVPPAPPPWTVGSMSPQWPGQKPSCQASPRCHT